MSILRLLRTGALFAIVLLGSAAALVAQPRVSVQLFQPPPNQLRIADVWRVRLVNNTNTTFTVCLYGTLDETALGRRLVDATTTRFTLPPGTKMVTGVEIQPIDATYHDEKYKNVFLRTGQAPTGEYRICVEVRNECGTEVLATDCKSAVVQQLTPPILISPPDESTVQEPLPAFSWLPPSPLRSGQRVGYKLRVVEILGRQSGYDAMQSNPSWFERGALNATVFPYPISSRKFRAGARYAWMITASDGDFPMGQSEIWSFTYQPVTLGDRPDEDTPNRGGRDTVPRSYDNGGFVGGLVDMEIYDFKPKQGAIVGFLNEKGRDRGVTLTDINTDISADKLKLIDANKIRDLLPPTIPPALLKELLRSCGGE